MMLQTLFLGSFRKFVGEVSHFGLWKEEDVMVVTEQYPLSPLSTEVPASQALNS